MDVWFAVVSGEGILGQVLFFFETNYLPALLFH